MISKKNLEEYAKKLMFEMNDNEYETLQKEFDVILKQMDLISKIENINLVEPMSHPFDLEEVDLRDDNPNNLLTTNDILLNAKSVEKNQIKVPKVVE